MSTYAGAISNDRWLCPICLDLLSDPAETPCCHNLFCLMCLQGLTKCPLCKKTLGVCPVNQPIQRLLGELSVQCPHCGKSVLRKLLEGHETTCELALLPCRHSAKCGLIPRGQQPQHEAECRYRPVTCKCGVVLPGCELSGHLASVCQEALVQCSLGCSAVVKRNAAEVHKKEQCPNGLTKCRNLSSTGEFCSVTCLRKEMAEHLLVCNYRKVPCASCQRRVIYADTAVHESVCESRLLPCPNSCGALVKRSEVSVHLECCSLEPVICPFLSCGCSTQVQRCALIGHLQVELQTHWVLAAERLAEVAAQMTTACEEIAELRSECRQEVKRLYSLLK